MKRPQTSLLLVVAGLTACTDTDPKRGQDRTTEPRDAAPRVIDVHAIGARSLDELTPSEAEAVCNEDAKRTDPCVAIALASGDPTACAAALAACNASRADAGPSPECQNAGFGRSGTCSVTVDEYLACVDAWNATQTCDRAGYRLATPEACTAVSANCNRFAMAFSRKGRAPPCDAPASPPAEDTDDDIFGADGCRPVPSRFVVLGDSIAQCFAEPAASCASYLIPELLKDHYAPDLAFEMHAVTGAVTADLPGQAQQVAGGPGHVAVWIWIIGNDLLAGNYDIPGWKALWAQVFDYFTDTSRFPGGVTFMLNGQYSVYDECGTSSESQLEATLREVNRQLFLDVAVARPDAIAIDHYPDWLGHTGYADTQGCPHCGLDNSVWTGAGPHPSAVGYTHITDKWSIAFESLYGGKCSQ